MLFEPSPIIQISEINKYYNYPEIKTYESDFFIITKDFFSEIDSLKSNKGFVLNNIFHHNYIQQILDYNFKESNFQKIDPDLLKKNFINNSFKIFDFDVNKIYEEGDEFTEFSKLYNQYIESIKDNIKQNNIKINFNEKINQNGIINNSADLKNYPSDSIWHEYNPSKYEDDLKILKEFDLNQFSYLEKNKPIKILHKISDYNSKEWSLIMTSEKIIGFIDSEKVTYIYEKEEIIKKELLNNLDFQEFNKLNIYGFFKEYIGSKYSWGRLDCSELIKRYFENFGFFLERDSSQQINSRIFNKIDIKKEMEVNNLDFNNLELKKKFIIENAVPFKSILYFPGHIMLYCGIDQNNEIILFHSISSTSGIKNENDKNLYKFFIYSCVIGNDPSSLYKYQVDYKPFKDKTIEKSIISIGNLEEIDIGNIKTL
jgi:hypothetical protein